MKTEKLLLELEALCEKNGYSIRKERGSFRGDACIMEGEKIIVINKNRAIETQIAILARVLKKINIEDTFVKPAVRKDLDLLWKQLNRFEEQENKSNITESL